jgi:UDP-2-acetamido-3-amino-2,3-dideoxy-glucuronate N-acetyltransferase
MEGKERLAINKNICLVGAGDWGKNHLRNLALLHALYAVVDPNKSLLNMRSGQYPDILFSENDQIIFNDPVIKGVVIAAPAVFHYQLAKKYLQAGKDVLLEKPLALNTSEGEELVALAEKKQCILMVGHVLQYHYAVLKLKELIDAGELGTIRYVYSNRLNIGKLRVEENVLWSFAPHDISLILMLLNNQEPVSVTAFGGAYINKGIYDTTMTQLEFPSGVKAHVFVSWLHPFKEQKLVVVGSKKMGVFDDVCEQKLVIYPHTIDFTKEQIPIAQKAPSLAVELQKSEPLTEELLHFIACMKERQTPRTDGREGLRVLRILQQAQNDLLRR